MVGTSFETNRADHADVATGRDRGDASPHPQNRNPALTLGGLPGLSPGPELGKVSPEPLRRRCGLVRKALPATRLNDCCRPEATEARRCTVGPKELKLSDALSVNH